MFWHVSQILKRKFIMCPLQFVSMLYRYLAEREDKLNLLIGDNILKQIIQVMSHIDIPVI